MCLALQMISQQNRNTESLREGILWGGDGTYLCDISEYDWTLFGDGGAEAIV